MLERTFCHSSSTSRALLLPCDVEAEMTDGRSLHFIHPYCRVLNSQPAVSTLSSEMMLTEIVVYRKFVLVV